jgi:hypothetical protein
MSKEQNKSLPRRERTRFEKVRRGCGVSALGILFIGLCGIGAIATDNMPRPVMDAGKSLVSSLPDGCYHEVYEATHKIEDGDIIDGIGQLSGGIIDGILDDCPPLLESNDDENTPVLQRTEVTNETVKEITYKNEANEPFTIITEYTDLNYVGFTDFAPEEAFTPESEIIVLGTATDIAGPQNDVNISPGDQPLNPEQVAPGTIFLRADNNRMSIVDSPVSGDIRGLWPINIQELTSGNFDILKYNPYPGMTNISDLTNFILERKKDPKRNQFITAIIRLNHDIFINPNAAKSLGTILKNEGIDTGSDSLFIPDQIFSESVNTHGRDSGSYYMQTLVIAVVPKAKQ